MGDMPSLKVKLLTRWRGMRKFTFNNGVKDGTDVRERLAYKMYRMAGVVAPKANSARVKFRKGNSGGSFQLYVNLQTIDADFLKENFRGTSGVTWDQIDGKYPGDDFSSKVRLNYCNVNPHDVLDCEEGCDDSSPALLQSLIDVAGTCEVGSVDLDQMWSKLDKDAYLRIASVDRIIDHWDGFCGVNRNNYRVHYGDEIGRFQIIPWSTDLTFTQGVPRDKDSYKCLQMRACLADAACENEYDQMYSEVLETFRTAKAELIAFVQFASAQAGKHIGKYHKPMMLVTKL
jgi:spore coat protein CotH